MQRWIAEVAVDQKHLAPDIGEVPRDRHRGERLPLRRAGAGNDQRARHPVICRELQRGAKRSVGFSETRARISELLIDACDLRDHPKQRQAETCSTCSGERTLSSSFSSRSANPREAPRPRRKANLSERIKLGDDGAPRHLRCVDNEDVVRADAACHVNLFVALQQAAVELAVGVHLAL